MTNYLRKQRLKGLLPLSMKMLFIMLFTAYVGETYAQTSTSNINVEEKPVSQFKDGLYPCDNKTYELLSNLSNSNLAGGEILLFTTTHQDFGWLNHIEACIIDRDTSWLTPFLNRLEIDPAFKMDIEQTSILMEYIHRHPDKKETINNYLKQGRICVGATFMQPYEEMFLGESLARQFYFGTRWLKENFDGYNASSYFNVDVPGRTLQMPQIMAKAGVNNLIISRHERGLFYWEAPDGSKVRTYTPGHYIYFYNLLAKNDAEAITELASESQLWYSKYNDIKDSKAVMPAMLNYEFIWDQKPVENCIPFTTKWNSITKIKNDSTGAMMNVNLPRFQYAIADEFFEKLDLSTSTLPVIKGERPNVWLYIHGPSHQHALYASRKADVLLPAAEMLSTFNILSTNSYANYPEQELNSAWLKKIYPDHGWGGKGGIMTDNTFLRMFENSLSEANMIISDQLNNIASQVKVDDSKGKPIVLFNTLSFDRSMPILLDVSFDKDFAQDIQIKDRKGKVVLSQLNDKLLYDDGSLKSAKVSFVSDLLPSMGINTYYLNPVSKVADDDTNNDSHYFENKFYKIEFANGGIKQIYDKELSRELLQTDKFLGGEVITMSSIGNGAGEFDAVQQPDMAGFDKTSTHNKEWELVEEGDVYSTYFIRTPIRNAVIEQRIKIYNQIKKIDVDVSLLNWDMTLYREYRWMLPLSLDGAKVAYETPYGAVTVGEDEMPGAAGERYFVKNKDQRPRGIGNWISASQGDFAITLSSSVAVADWVDPTTSPVDYTILQPILLASRKSCHWEGNEYLNPGDHYFHFSLTSHSLTEQSQEEFGLSANTPVFTVYNPQTYNNANLNEIESFLSINNPNVIISALKKSEDDNSLIIRLYNTGGEKESVNLKMGKSYKLIKTNLIEEELSSVKKIILEPYAIETFKIIF